MSHQHNPQHLEGATKQALETGRTRLLVAGAVFVLAFLAVAARLADVTVFQSGAEPKLAHNATPRNAWPTTRADIVDRNGNLLATSLVTASLYANPRQIIDSRDAAKKLNEALPELSVAELQTKLSGNRSFIWLHRHLTPKQQYEVNRLGIPGVYFQRDERRVYPQGPLTSHVVGFTGVDNDGLAGIERSFDETLKSGGHSLALSIDLRVQHVLRQEILAGMHRVNAIGGAGMVIDVHTGELMAMVSLPDFDPHNPTSLDPKSLFNRNTLGVYEMGSMFKLFTASLAIDSGSATLASTFDASHPIKISRFTISDFQGQNRVLSLPEVLVYSSNIGAAKMALQAGTDVQKKYLAAFGLLKTPTIELPEVAAPMYPAQWREINTMTIGFGHGIAVSPLQMASGIVTIANGGVIRPVTLLKRGPGEVPEGNRVISPRTAEQVKRLMRLVVTDGSGKAANAPGYLVGGKTGTAEKVSEHGGYKRRAVLSSFVGAFPMTDPKYVILVSIDEPQPIKENHNYITAGWVTTPVVGRIIPRIAPLLGVSPVDDQDASIKAKMYVNYSKGRASDSVE
ncbi:MAG TPA: penicillin-binding protein 2 [Alphaproteobacteria bacterium]|jgi:cell division protein FtsI (penicillin-binding protein 3)